MKYLLVILLIIVAVSAATMVAIWPGKTDMSSAAIVTINGHPLTREDIIDYKKKDFPHGSNEDFINEIITKQLMIAEAQRLGLDHEPDFRQALKTFYEHSLIKVLMERVNNDTNVEVSDEEVDKFLAAFGKTFTLYTLDSAATASAAAAREHGERVISSFEDLSGALQQILSSMEPGQTSTIFVSGNEKLTVYLDKVEGQGGASQNIDREQIRQQLLQAKRERKVNSWIEDLRKKASITFHTTQE